jgi:hypothetical protein
VNKIVMVLAVLAALVSNAGAQEAQEKPAMPTYSDVQRTCGMEWRERTDKDTNKGREAWQAFLKECTKRKGYVSKRDQRVPADFVRVPDKQ